ncbi:UNVERIFIED_CONTAM: hypothetical protein Sradi_6490300 [Sesamum radiatum]|uniref:Uncharacterized protein n=1 Tax=Sesamum radiatum TaxID=300843 RepID=A0AAW2JVA2_SESRA
MSWFGTIKTRVSSQFAALTFWLSQWPPLHDLAPGNTGLVRYGGLSGKLKFQIRSRFSHGGLFVVSFRRQHVPSSVSPWSPFLVRFVILSRKLFCILFSDVPLLGKFGRYRIFGGMLLMFRSPQSKIGS